MNQAAIRQELHDLRIMISEIHAVLTMGREYDRAIKQFVKGNKKPLDDFIKKGGMPPGMDTGASPA
jgi:hypothetical protein